MAILSIGPEVDFLRSAPPVLTDLQVQRINVSPLCTAI